MLFDRKVFRLGIRLKGKAIQAAKIIVVAERKKFEKCMPNNQIFLYLLIHREHLSF